MPLRGEASFAQIAAATDLHEDFVTRIIRYAATSRIFKESRPGWVIHTAASRALLEDKLLRGFLVATTDGGFAAAAKLNEAVDKYGHTGSRYETAFCVAFGLEREDFFDFMERPEQQWRKAKFAECMQFRARNEEAASAVSKECDPLLNGSFDWDAVGLVVDVSSENTSVSGIDANIGTGRRRRGPYLRFYCAETPKASFSHPRSRFCCIRRQNINRVRSGVRQEPNFVYGT